MTNDAVAVTAADEAQFVRQASIGKSYEGGGFPIDAERPGTAIRASLIRALMLGQPVAINGAPPLVIPVPAGIVIWNCTIEGELDLENGGNLADALMPALCLHYCYVPETINLQSASLARLSLHYCVISYLAANGMNCLGDLDLRDVATFEAYYQVDIRNSKVGGWLAIGDMRSRLYFDAQQVIGAANKDNMLGQHKIEKFVRIDEAEIGGYAVISSNSEDNRLYRVATTVSAECLVVKGDLIFRNLLLDDFFESDPEDFDVTAGLIDLTRAKVKSLKVDRCSQGLTRRMVALKVANEKLNKLESFITYNCEGLYADDFISFESSSGNKNLKNAWASEFYDDILPFGRDREIMSIDGQVQSARNELDLIDGSGGQDASDRKTNAAELNEHIIWLGHKRHHRVEDCRRTNNMIDAVNFAYDNIRYPKSDTLDLQAGDASWVGRDTRDSKSRHQDRNASVHKEPRSAVKTSRGDGRREIKLKLVKNFLCHIMGFVEVPVFFLGLFGKKIRFRGNALEYSPQILMQLAKIEYDHGDVQTYKDIMILKNWIDIDLQSSGSRGVKRNGKRPGKLAVRFSLFRLVNRLIGVCFGFGYSPGRALMTLIVYLTVGAVGVSVANSTHMLVVNTQPVASTSWSDSIMVPVGDKVTSNIPCKDSISAPFYALDVMVPLLELHQQEKCEIKASVFHKVDVNEPIRSALAYFKFDDRLLVPTFEISFSLIWMWANALFALFGWIVTSLAVLTFSGILRQKAD